MNYIGPRRRADGLVLAKLSTTQSGIWHVTLGFASIPGRFRSQDEAEKVADPIRKALGWYGNQVEQAAIDHLMAMTRSHIGMMREGCNSNRQQFDSALRELTRDADLVQELFSGS